MPRKRLSARDLNRMLADINSEAEHLLAPGPSRVAGSTVMEDLKVRASMSARPDGYPSSSVSQGVVLTKPASQPGLRTDPTDAKPPPHEEGFAEDTTIERIAEARMNDICEQCKGVPSVPACNRCNGTGRRFADPQGEAYSAIEQAVRQMYDLALLLRRKRAIIEHAADNHRGRQSTLGGNCDVCTEFVTGVGEDRLRSKMCPRCYLKHGSWKLKNPSTDDPGADRRRFKEFMLKWLAEQEPQEVAR